MRQLLRTALARSVALQWRAAGVLALLAIAVPAWAQRNYPYGNVPAILYVIGEPNWDGLSASPEGARLLTLYTSLDKAQADARGMPIRRIERHRLQGTPDGEAFLKKAEDLFRTRDLESVSISITSPSSLTETVVKRTRGLTELAPQNPNWQTSGSYATKPMGEKYRPGGANDDYKRGTFYFPSEGSPEAINFINNFKVTFQPQPDGSVLMMQPDPNHPGQFRPIDTRGLFGAGAEADRNTCIYVMDAAGNFYVLAPEWVVGLGAAYGLDGINHSSIPGGHDVAAAGHMTIEEGKLKLIDNRSGHYEPSNAMTVQAINALQRGKVAKGSYKVSFGNGAKDHPGADYIGLDPEGKAKVAKGVIDPAPEVASTENKPPVAENKPQVNDAEILQPPEPKPDAQLDVDRRAGQQPQPPATAPENKPVAPPDAAVVDAIKEKIKSRPADKMDKAFLIELYKMDPAAAKLVGQIVADPLTADKNFKLGQIRKQMDLEVWKKILSDHNIHVEITNQGKSNGIRSDLDYTLYYVAEATGLKIEDLIKEHGETWKALHEGITPEQVEIKVMNGDEFYPDWRTESLSEFEHQAQVKDVLSRLRSDPEKYYAPGGNKQQVHNRALTEGYTQILKYNPEADKPGAKIEDVVVHDEGPTREIAERYRGVHGQYNHMNALGNVVQNFNEYLHHTGDGTQDAIRRAKYGNRIINEGLGNLRFFANNYQQILDGNLPEDKKQAMLKDYLKKTFGLLKDDNGKPLFDDAALERFKRVIDISMKIELDKTKNRADYSKQEVREGYFAQYMADAEAKVLSQDLDKNVTPEEHRKQVLAEAEKLFEADHKRVLAEAVLSGLRESVARDLTPEGVLRNRVRFDPATNKFVIDDPAGAQKVAFERAVEVALFYEVVNSIEDPFLRHDLKKRALSTAPNMDLAEFYGALDQVDHAEIDRFVKSEPGNKVQRTIEDLLKKNQERALELAIEQKQKAVDAAKAKGVPVEPTTVAPDQVRDNIVDGRMWGLNAEQRAQFRQAYQQLGNKLSGDFKEAFYNNASALMLGSSAVNLARAYQMGCAQNDLKCASVMTRAAFSEAVWYMPDYIQTPWLVLDLAVKVREGDYSGAAWSAGLFGAMAYFPSLGHAMLAYNIINGGMEIAYTHFTRYIDRDLTEHAFKSRPRDRMGKPLGNSGIGQIRARPTPFPDAKTSVYRGSPPGFPLWFGRYKNDKAIAPVAVVDGANYSDGAVPHDDLSDAELADTAAVEFAPVIDSILVAERLEVGSDAWRKRAWDLKIKFGFDIPFYRRINKVYNEKYKYITFTDYLAECKLDVYDWYNKQPEGYKDELAGEARGLGLIFRFLSDKTDQMQDMIAHECAGIMESQRQAAEHAEEVDQANKAAFKAIMQKAFDAERAVLAAKQSLHQRIQTEEEKAAKQLEQKALDLAKNHKTYFAIKYPFTYASEEMWPTLDFDVRTLPANVKGPVRLTVDEEVIDIKDGAPGGWAPGKEWADKFKTNPANDNWVDYRPITANVRFTGHLLDKDSAEVAQSKLELPIVLYEPTVDGYVSVTVYGMGEKGDSSYYNGALVTLGNVTKPTMELGGTFFGKLKPGTYSVQVKPPKSDERHAAGTGSGTIVDVLLSKDPKAKQNATIVVKLPYIPEKKTAADSTANKPNPPGGGGGGAGKDSTNAGGGKGGAGGAGGGKGGGKDSTGTKGGKDSTGAKGGKDSTNVKGGGKDSTNVGPNVNDIINKLTPLTSKAEKARDDAKKSCQYIAAANAQQELVNAAKSFLASSFPKGAPADVQKIADGFDAELTALKKAASAQEKANVFLREGLAAVQAKHAEPALAALEKAAAVPDIPQCLYDQVMATYNEMKADVEKRMKLIDKAVEAANDKCDFAAAQSYGEQVEAEDKTLSWVVNELPKIKDLNRRQKLARQLAAQAEAKAAEAEQVAQAGNVAQATAVFDQALQLAQQALVAAPACEKENLKSLLDLPARKAALGTSKVDQSLILLLDTSGSMSENSKMENAKQAATDAVKSLGPTTEIAVISFDGGCSGGWRVVQGFTTNHQSLIGAIATLHPGGGTPTAPAIGFAQDYLQKNGRGKAGQIMLMTDGQNDCGSMRDAGAALRNSSIPVRLDAVGFGLGNDAKAQSDLATLVGAAGNGNTYNANSAKELISAFRRAFITNQIKPRDPFVSGEAGTRLAQLFAAAIEFLKANNLDGALGQLRTAADQFPASPAAAFNASLGYEAAGQPLQAMNYAKKYLNLAPNAFDASQVQARIDMLEKEQAANPRAIFTPTDCSALYRWALTESRANGLDATRKAKVFDIMTTAQRGDCAAAQAAYDKYTQQYGKRP